MKIKFSSLQNSLLLFQIIGYPVIAATSVILALPNSIISLAARTFFFGIAIALVFFTSQQSFNNWQKHSLLILLLFWIAYLSRLFEQTVLNPINLSRDGIDYWIWALGGSLIPLLAMTHIKRGADHRHTGVVLVFAAAAVAIAVLILGTTNVVTSTGQSYDSGRLRFESLNPISVGHAGATLTIVCLWNLVGNHQESRSSLRHLYIAFSLLGFWAILSSASRGPLVALAATILTFIFATSSARTLLRSVIAISLATMIGTIYIATNPTVVESLASRVADMMSGEDFAVNERGVAYSGALKLFFESPLTGSSIEEPITKQYPHNIILEALIATGVLGGLFLCWLIARLTHAAIRIVRLGLESSWVALLFIQYLVGALFSGSVYSSTTFWCLAGAVIGINSHAQKQFQRKQVGDTSSRKQSSA